MNEENKLLSVFCTRNNSISGLKKDVNLWKLPQGGIEKDEDIKDAFLREMDEELGLDFIDVETTIKDWNPDFSYYFLDDKCNPAFEIRLHPVLVKICKNKNIRLDKEENLKFDWCNPKLFLLKELGIRKKAYENILDAFGLK